MAYKDFWKTITTGAAVYNHATPAAARIARLKRENRLLPNPAAAGTAQFWLAVGVARSTGRLSQEQYMNMNQPELTRLINDAFGVTATSRSWTVQMVLDSPDGPQARVKELIFVSQDIRNPFAIRTESLPWHSRTLRFSD